MASFPMHSKPPRSDKQQVILAIRTDRTAADVQEPDVVLFMTPVGSAFSDDSAGDGDDEDDAADKSTAAESMLFRLAARHHCASTLPSTTLPTLPMLPTLPTLPTLPPTPPAESRPKTTVSTHRRHPSTVQRRARPSTMLEEPLTAVQRARRWFEIAARFAGVVGHLEHGAVERAGASMLATVACVEQSMWGLGLLPASRYRAALRRHGRVGVPWRVVGWPAKRAFWLRIHALARTLFEEHTRRVHLYNAAFASYREAVGYVDGLDDDDDDGDDDYNDYEEEEDVDDGYGSLSDASGSDVDGYAYEYNLHLAEDHAAAAVTDDGYGSQSVSEGVVAPVEISTDADTTDQESHTDADAGSSSDADPYENADNLIDAAARSAAAAYARCLAARPDALPPPDVMSTQTLVRLHKAVGVLHARLYGTGGDDDDGCRQRRRYSALARPRRGRRVAADLPPRTLFRSLADTVLFQIDDKSKRPPSSTADLWV